MSIIKVRDFYDSIQRRKNCFVINSEVTFEGERDRKRNDNKNDANGKWFSTEIQKKKFYQKRKYLT